jgi:hypothetical protein
VYAGNELVALGALLERSRLAGSLGMQFEGDRDMYTTLGYPQTISFAQFLGEYLRGDIAGRVVDLPASDTWRTAPVVADGESGDRGQGSGVRGQGTAETPFEQAFAALDARLHVWHYLERLDRLSGIGRFGVLLLGAHDGLALDEPLKQGSLKRPEDVLYLSVYSEGSTQILTFDREPQSARFGLPETYQIQLGSPGLGFGAAVVHWSRLIHVAEGLTEDEVYGRPRLERIYNRLQDLMKIVGGGSEAAWRVMDRGLHADVQAGFELKDPEQVSDEIEEYLHGLRRFIRTQGIDIKTLGAEMVDPSGLFGILISLIAAASDIPQRILIGAEAGELASSQDAAQWAGQIRARRTKFAEPMLLRPFIDRLLWAGALPPAQGGTYTVAWQPLFELDELQRGQVAAAYAGAVAAFAPVADQVVAVEEFRADWLGLPAELPAAAQKRAADKAAAAAEAEAKAEAEARGQESGGRGQEPGDTEAGDGQEEDAGEAGQGEEVLNEAEQRTLSTLAGEYVRASELLGTLVRDASTEPGPELSALKTQIGGSDGAA